MRPVFLLGAFTLLTLARGNAEVLDSAAGGFTVRTTIEVKAPPAEVYKRLIQDIGDWWDSAHTFSHDSHNLSIEEKPMGCFCEKLPNGGSARHLEVVYFAPGKTVLFHGGLGPLLALATSGSLEVQLTPVNGGTKLVATYAVAGYLAAGLNTWAAPVDSVLALQFGRLRNFAERGDPAAKAGN